MPKRKLDPVIEASTSIQKVRTTKTAKRFFQDLAYKRRQSTADLVRTLLEIVPTLELPKPPPPAQRDEISITTKRGVWLRATEHIAPSGMSLSDALLMAAAELERREVEAQQRAIDDAAQAEAFA